jgi:hypothetical protein
MCRWRGVPLHPSRTRTGAVRCVVGASGAQQGRSWDVRDAGERRSARGRGAPEPGGEAVTGGRWEGDSSPEEIE